jgi:tRNA A-37 threonylcarbamoyl transferase component Bud32
MERDSGKTLPSTSGTRHPTIAQLREGSHPDVDDHLASCAQCQSVIAADAISAPIPLDLPKGLVSENAFKWPADPIARGGMAEIFLGEDRRLGRMVILKAPRDGEELAPGHAQMFQRRVTAEARILAKLQHPSIVTIHELGKSTVGWPFVVLERVDGTSLRDRLDELTEAEKDGKPRTRERLELLSNLMSIAEALAYAHERNVVHRDCTPNNILLGKRGEATLIDWGIARDLDAPAIESDAASINAEEPSMSGRMVTISAGTPPYLPYGQTQGRQAEPGFDVYSFGITLYEVVSGTTPFEWRAEETSEARTKQLLRFLEWAQSDDPIPPAMPKDRELSGIIARAIDRDADKRFTSDELLRALKQYLTGDLVFSHRYSMTGRLARWARRNRALTVGVVSLIAFVIAGALVWAQLSRRAKEQAELETIAAGARADAEREGREADEAQRQAADALALADKAQKEGKSSDELRKKADELRQNADAKRRRAEDLEKQAKGNAEEAIKRFQEANKIKEEAERERDLARIGRTDAEKVRDAAKQAQLIAERDRDTAKQAKLNAESERDAALAARQASERERDAAKGSAVEAEKARDAAREGQGAAEKERDAATAARIAAERERDEARRKIAELEARLNQNRPPPPPPPPGGNEDLE